jgi:sec-independent protein translocase protein TatC
LVVATCVAFAYGDAVLKLLVKSSGHLVFLAPCEAFLTRLKIAFYCGGFATLPLVLWQVWEYIRPGLLDGEISIVRWILPAAYVLFFSGVGFGCLVVPVAVGFLLGYGMPEIQPMISVASYVSFLLIMLASFGMAFQIPWLLFVGVKLRWFSSDSLRAKRGHALVVIFIAAGILTPGPDIFSQFCMALPLYGLYEIGIAVSRWAGTNVGSYAEDAEDIVK